MFSLVRMAEELRLRILTFLLKHILHEIRNLVLGRSMTPLVSPLQCLEYIIDEKLGDVTHRIKILPFVVSPWWQPLSTRNTSNLLRCLFRLKGRCFIADVKPSDKFEVNRCALK
jgi:hypothetical protein